MSESNVHSELDSMHYWGPGVYLKSEDVNMTQVDTRVMTFLGRLGDAHSVLFGLPVVVTSGRDSLHVASSKHATGQAVDIRITDKRPEWRPAFLLVCGVLAEQLGLALFDESHSTTAPHLHVEVAS